jgi:hypothetical protein
MQKTKRHKISKIQRMVSEELKRIKDSKERRATKITTKCQDLHLGMIDIVSTEELKNGMVRLTVSYDDNFHRNFARHLGIPPVSLTRSKLSKEIAKALKDYVKKAKANENT